MRVVLGVLIGSSISPELLGYAKAILGAVLCVPEQRGIGKLFGSLDWDPDYDYKSGRRPLTAG